jgi:hypothetical protein
VEGLGGYLEEQTGGEQDPAERDQGILTGVAQSLLEGVELHRACGSVQERNAVEQDARGEGSEDEILDQASLWHLQIHLRSAQGVPGTGEGEEADLHILEIKGYRSGCSMESTARSMSRSGQYRW